MKRILYIIAVLPLLLLNSCDDKSNTSSTTKSSVAKLSAFTFARNDTMPGLAQAKFTVEDRVDTGLVWNKDSILYGTSLKKVVPKFTFAATPGAAFVRTPDTLCVLTGYDTLDFSVSPIYLTIRSADTKNTKVYEIKATVHQVDPDLYNWERLTDEIYPIDDSEQRVVEFDQEFLMIKSNGFELNCYKSLDGETWTDLGEPIGLPAGTKVRQIISSGDSLFYGEGKNVYISTDAVTWTAHPVNDSVVTMVIYWNKKIWALVKRNDVIPYVELATWEDSTLQLSGLKPIEEDFPVSDFATVCFNSASTRERAMIVGGFAENGRSLNTRWNLEYSRHEQENNGYRLQEFSIGRPHFNSLTGSSIIWYNNQLLMFGGVDENMRYFGREVLISKDEGLTWTEADSTKNSLPVTYTARQKQNAIVRDNNIYVFGGQDGTRTYSDVYEGRLNSIDW